MSDPVKYAQRIPGMRYMLMVGISLIFLPRRTDILFLDD